MRQEPDLLPGRPAAGNAPERWLTEMAPLPCRLVSDRVLGLALCADLGELLHHPFRARRRHETAPHGQRACWFTHASSKAPGCCRQRSFPGPCPRDTTHSNFSISIRTCEAVAGDTWAWLAMSITPNHSRCRSRTACSTGARRPRNMEQMDRDRLFGGGLSTHT